MSIPRSFPTIIIFPLDPGDLFCLQAFLATGSLLLDSSLLNLVLHYNDCSQTPFCSLGRHLLSSCYRPPGASSSCIHTQGCRLVSVDISVHFNVSICFDVYAISLRTQPFFIQDISIQVSIVCYTSACSRQAAFVSSARLKKQGRSIHYHRACEGAKS